MHDGHSLNDLVIFTKGSYRDSEFDCQLEEVLDKCNIEEHIYS